MIIVCVLGYVLASYFVTWALLLRLNTIGGDAPPPENFGRFMFLLSPLPSIWMLLAAVWVEYELSPVYKLVGRAWNRFCERIGI